MLFPACFGYGNVEVCLGWACVWLGPIGKTTGDSKAGDIANICEIGIKGSYFANPKSISLGKEWIDAADIGRLVWIVPIYARVKYGVSRRNTIIQKGGEEQ